MRKIVITISIILLMVAMAGTVFALTGTVNTNELNLRDGASLSSNVITRLNKNEILNIIGEEGDWYKVSYKNYTGYVSKQYLDKNEDTNQNIDENTTSVEEENKILSTATVYALPLLNSTKIGTLEQGKTVTIISQVGNWRYVQTNEIMGWILSSKVEESLNSDNNNSNENQVSNENSTTENNTIENNTTSNTTTTNNNNTNTTNNEENNYPTTLYVNVEAVNIREEATTSSDVVASIGLNTPVRVTGESGDWYKVEVSDGKGYIMKKYLSKTQN